MKGYEPKELEVPHPREGRTYWKAPPTDKERNQVYTYALYGATDEDISSVMEMSEPTLKKYFRKELTNGRVHMKSKIGQRLYHMAIGNEELGIPPSFNALAFVAKTKCGWKETHVVENIEKKQSIRIYLPDNGKSVRVEEEEEY